ncbi:MAG: hypothetical protein ACI9KS_002505, partial [Sulfitobacter sp.]
SSLFCSRANVQTTASINAPVIRAFFLSLRLL